MARPARARTITPSRGSIVTKAFSAIRSVKGTRDLLPSETPLWQRVEEEARRVFDAYNFREIRTPVLERTDLFARSVGADTDIVTKEMYTFQDRDEESLTLRPEATASVVRAYIEHRLFHEGGVHKLYYLGPMFRRERPQKGRYRQFYQIGAEVLGSDHPTIDAEVLEMLTFLLARLGLREFSLLINSVGCGKCRPTYVEVLREALQGVKSQLCADCQRRAETNPLRVLDCKVEADQAQIARLPRIVDYLCADCRKHFDGVKAELAQRGVAYEINPRLVRGLDYYTRTTFEITSSPERAPRWRPLRRALGNARRAVFAGLRVCDRPGPIDAGRRARRQSEGRKLNRGVCCVARRRSFSARGGTGSRAPPAGMESRNRL